MAVCCSNAIVSSVDPCCAEQWAMRWNPSTLSLKLMDWKRRDVTSWAVETVNGKSWKVVITKEDILWTPTVDTSVLTWKGWADITNVVTEWSRNLITSWWVFEYVKNINTELGNMHDDILDVRRSMLTRDIIVQVLTPVSSQTTIPSAKSVYDFVESRWVVWAWAIDVVKGSEWDWQVSAKQSNVTQQWVVKLASVSDYNNSDTTTALTPSVVKPIIDDIKASITVINNRINQANAKFEEQVRINESLQKQIDELKEALNNKDKA